MKLWTLKAIVVFSLGFVLDPYIVEWCRISMVDKLEAFYLLLFGVALLCLAECLQKMEDAAAARHKDVLRVQHPFNPLPLYCCLLRIGLGKRISILICKGYEKLVYGRASRLSLILDGQVKRSR